MAEHQMEWPRIARRIRVPLGFVFAIVYFWFAQPQWISIALGMILILPGLLIRALASGHVRKNEALATSGPYAYARNPLYLGSLLIGLGFAVASRSWWIGLLLVLMLFAVYAPVILDEEKFLRQRFPEFGNYAQQVPRMFPKLVPPKRQQNDPASRFSLGLYMQHREYNAAIGAALMLVALVVKMIWLHSST
jgi:protein-S-isoprenylcysteine O-methyltransferase Ste14